MLYYGLVRRALPFVLAAALMSIAVGSGDARTPDVQTYAYGAGAQAPNLILRAGQAPAGFSGGPVTASDGETVTVYIADTLLSADPNAGQRWANVLAGLLHGPELRTITLYVATVDLVREICGSRALGCYGRNTIVAIGEDQPTITAQGVVTHEYGHHIAQSSDNDPWSAADWGTKRWASYENVCKRAQEGELAPGDEGALYQQNPGEAFAEDYRVLNERREGLAETSWQVVASSLYPDQGALDQLALDITQPWTGVTTTSFTVKMSARATGRGFRIATPLDGSFSASLTSPAKVRLALRVVDPASGKVLTANTTALRVKSASLTICGERLLQVQIRRLSGAGTFTLAVTKP